jgi:hypothetical protein
LICYASRTGTRRNLAALRAHGWGLLVSRAGRWRTEGFERICGDNGAWADFHAGREFDADAYERFLDWLAAEPVTPDWLVLPDIVAGGLASLSLSLRYLNRCRAVAPLVLISVQDGMTAADVAPLVGPQVGIFLGGSTSWKLDRMAAWGEFCASRGVHYHVARVNTAKRMFMAIAAGASSIDGSSASRYAVTTAMLTSASRHRDLFAARPYFRPDSGGGQLTSPRDRADLPDPSGAPALAGQEIKSKRPRFDQSLGGTPGMSARPDARGAPAVRR